MILIADSGATKTEWCALRRGMESFRFRTGPVNVAVMPQRAVREVFDDALKQLSVLLPEMAAGKEGPRDGIASGTVSEVDFFAAGLVCPKLAESLAAALRECFPGACIGTDTDLMGAAKALWGDTPGVVAVLGTGSNSCIYDGRRIVRNVRPGGFVLGDEGGGAALGKMLLADFVKGLLPGEITALLEKDGLDYAAVVNNVYKSDRPSAYLASFVPFVFEHKDVFHDMIYENFRSFVRRSLKQYASVDEVLKVGVAGSVGWAGKDIFIEAAREEGIEAVKFLRSPMDGLIEYYNSRVY